VPGRTYRKEKLHGSNEQLGKLYDRTIKTIKETINI